MPVTKLKSAIVLTLLLTGRAGHAQQQHPAAPPAKSETTDLTVRVELPAALTAIKDYAGILLSKDQDKLKAVAARRKQKSPPPVLSIPLTLPRSWAKKLTGE